MDLLEIVLNNKLALVPSFILGLAIIGLLLGFIKTLWTCTIKIRSYNPKEGKVDVGFRPRHDMRCILAIVVGWVE